jgi:hypothetical protein
MMYRVTFLVVVNANCTIEASVEVESTTFDSAVHNARNALPSVISTEGQSVLWEPTAVLCLDQ